MNSAGKSVTGLIRKNNEDAIYSGKDDGLKGLYIVADGMGGHNAGEVASRRAIDVFRGYVRARAEIFFDDSETLDIMTEALQEANRKVYEWSVNKEVCSGMGTTLDAVVLRQNRLFVTHVGDGRVYLLRDGVMRRLTEDHSYVEELIKSGRITEEEALRHPKRNIITRAVGTNPEVMCDCVVEEMKYGDVVLLCTDGLTNMVMENDIKAVLEDKTNLVEKTEKLVEMANNNGGIDNISLIIIKHEVEL